MDKQTGTSEESSGHLPLPGKRPVLRRRSAIRYEPGSKLAEADAYFLMRILSRMETEKERERLVSIAERILVTFAD